MAMKFPQHISTTHRSIMVVGMIDYAPLINNTVMDENLTDEEKKEIEEFKENISKRKITYRDGKGYVDENEYIWIYCAKGKPKNPNAYPYFWINDDGEKEFSQPTELVKKAFSVDRMVDLSEERIIDDTIPYEQHYDEQMLNDINAASSLFLPTVHEYDDFLKLIIKLLILCKGVDINGLKSKTCEKYVLPNMKSALQNKTKMSVIYFMTWMELLGCDFEITIYDNGEDKKSQLKEPIVYKSHNHKVYKIKANGELEEIQVNTFIDERDNDDE